MLRPENAIFVLIDVQGKLAQVMHDREALFENLQRLLKGLQLLQVPVIWMEQIPEKMGSTLPELSSLLINCAPISKTSFSCWRSTRFRTALKASGRQQVIVAGIETHVCVYQTSAHLAEEGFSVEVVADAVSSRSAANKQIGLDKIKAAGALLTSVETVLFELMGDARHSAFREILPIVK